MSHRATWASLALLLAGCAATTPVGTSATPAPGADPLKVESSAFFGATVTAWAKTDAAGAITDVGLTVPQAVIDGAPTDAAAKPSSLILNMPEKVRKETFLDHLSLDWNPKGHEPPGTYDVPHFDFHFYNMANGDVAAIDCKDTTTVPAARIPQGFALLPPPNGQCVPQMGIHASDLSSPELAQTNPAKFTKTMILGYYKGAMTFIEPMMTQAYLQQKEAFTLNIPAPAELGKSTMLPTTFSGSFDATAKAYTFTFTGFKAAK
jgi:hypothetical protein